MAEGFKAQLQRDLETVFLNTGEHADNLDVEYNGTRRNIPVIIDTEGNKDRTKVMRDNADGVYITEVAAFMSFHDLKIVPRKDTKIIIDGTQYMIKHSGFCGDMITLDLEDYDE